MKRYDKLSESKKQKVKFYLYLPCALILFSIALHYGALPNPITSDETNVARVLDSIGNDPQYRKGVNVGVDAYINHNYTIYSDAIKYCELVVKPGDIDVLKDPGFKYNFGIIHGYEQQFEP